MGQSRCFVRLGIAWGLLSALALAASLGCCASRYRYCGDLHTEHDAGIAPGESQIERGRQAPVLDAVGWVVGVPAKIIMLDHRVSNHNVSQETETRLQEYLACNELDKVKVRINEYDPWGEWKRLTRNESVGWPLRYTFGTLSVVEYTLLPGRVFGGDAYNPFTNTVNLYSDVPAIAVYEGAYAKDYAQREYKGLYAVARVVPGVGMVCHDAHASSDAIEYFRENGTPQDIKGGYRAVYPAYALNASEPIASVTGLTIVLPAVAAGHVVGQIQAAAVSEKEAADGPRKEGIAPYNTAGASPELAAGSTFSHR